MMSYLIVCVCVCSAHVLWIGKLEYSLKCSKKGELMMFTPRRSEVVAVVISWLASSVDSLSTMEYPWLGPCCPPVALLHHSTRSLAPPSSALVSSLFVYVPHPSR